MKYIKLFEDYASINIKDYELTSDVLNIIDVGMYDSELSSDVFLYDIDMELDGDEDEEEEARIREEYDEAYDNFSNEKYCKMIQDNAATYISQEVLPELKDICPAIIDIEVTGIYSPKSYNYGSDLLEFTVKIDRRKLIWEIDMMSGIADFEEYLKEEYSSRSGFISFMPDNMKEFWDLLNDKEDDWKPITQYLNYKIKNELRVEGFGEWLRDNEQDKSIYSYQNDTVEE